MIAIRKREVFSERGFKAILLNRLAEIQPLERFLYSSVIIASVLMRFIELSSRPLPFADEVLAAADIRAQLRTGHHFSGAPVIFYDWMVTLFDGRLLSGVVLGTSLLDLRLISATFGVLTMVALIWLGIEIGSVRVGVISACMYGFMPWAVYFNRVFIPDSEYGFLSLVGFILIVRALRNHHCRCLYVAVVPLVMAIYLYPPALITSPGIALLVTFIYRKEILAHHLKHVLGSGLLAVCLLGYFAFVHFFPPTASLTNADATISSQGLWQHQLSVMAMIDRFVVDWASYLNPLFLLVHGDPTTPRQTIGVLGEVGYVIGCFGLLGIVSAIRGRSREQTLLVSALFLYPVVDALTYWNANGSSVVGFLGCIVWSVLAANGILFVIGYRPKSDERRLEPEPASRRNAVLSISFCLLALQMIFFSWYYLVRYPIVTASNFEIGLPQVIPILYSHDATRIPLILQGAYQEGAMLDYYDNDEPKVLGSYLDCSVLPYDATHYVTAGTAIVIHESSAYEGTAGCVAGNQLITLDLKALKMAGTRFVVWSVYANAPGSTYRTAVVFIEVPRERQHRAINSSK